MAEIFIQGGCNVNARDLYGETALHHAAKKGHRVMATYLVENHANLKLRDSNGDTPAHLAYSNGYESLAVERLEGKEVIAGYCLGIPHYKFE